MSIRVSDEQREQLDRDGWCVIPGVLTSAQATDALDRLWAVASANERAGIPTAIPAIDPNDCNVRVMNLIQTDRLFRDLIQNETALEMVRAVIGPDFEISNFTANIARPGSGSMPIHSDQSFVAPQPWSEPWSVNIIWCLTDVHGDNGATLFIPGSHKWRTRAEVPANCASMLRPFEAKAGSIVVMEGRIWHTSGKNVTDAEDRACLFGYYSTSFLRAQVNWNVALSPEIQASLSTDMREWLGLNLLPNLPRSFLIDVGVEDFGASIGADPMLA